MLSEKRSAKVTPKESYYSEDICGGSEEMPATPSVRVQQQDQSDSILSGTATSGDYQDLLAQSAGLIGGSLETIDEGSKSEQDGTISEQTPAKSAQKSA